MSPDDREPFAKAIRAAWALHGRDVTPDMLALFWGVLQRHDLADVLRAVRLSCGAKQYGPPKPGELAELIEGSSETQAMRAWTRVLEAIQRVGAYTSVVFDDPVVHAVVVDLGGWTELCKLTVDDTPYRARDFERRYQGYAARRVVPPYPPVLLGLVAHDPAAHPADTAPVLLGDREVCERVRLAGSAEYQAQRLARHEPEPALLLEQAAP